MSYRAGIQARAREAAEAARDEVLHAELRGLENLLACCRAEPIPDKQQIDEIRRTIKWVRRQLRLPPSGEERRPSRPAEPQPEPITEEPPNQNQHICWHEERPWWGFRCRGDHTDDQLVIYGTCRADRDRWFWSAESIEATGVVERYGFTESAVRARIAAREAVVDLAAGRLTLARQSNDRAAWALRRIHPPDRPTPRDPLADLRAAMVAAHPDKGGDASGSDFIQARSAYVEARRRMRTRSHNNKRTTT